MNTLSAFHKRNPRIAPRLRWSLTLLAAAALAACTWRTEHKVETVSKIDAHIVLDIRQIQDQAAQNEDFVRKDAPTTTTTPAGDKPASFLATELALRQMAASGRRAPWFAPSAQAQPPQAVAPAGADEKRKALEGRKARLKKIDEALDKGSIGENDLGFVEARIPKDSPDKASLAAAEQLARDENADRKTLYRLIAQEQKGGAEVEKAVGIVSAGPIRDRLKKGQYFQAPRDEKMFAEFQKSPLGKAHADAKPGDWVKKAIDPEKKA